jgi:hypothetical protein
MKTISTLLLLTMLMGILGCDTEDQPKPAKEPPPAPTVPQPQVK